MRVMAINMDDDLFDELKKHVKENGLTLKEYITDIISKDLKEHTLQQDEYCDDAPCKAIKWGKEDLITAIDDFITQNHRAPTQKEFRTENGLPSYNAARRCLEQLPSEYCRLRVQQLQVEEELEEPEKEEGFSMSM